MNWLIRENELAEKQERAFRDAREEEEMLLMRHPVAARQAYARFGLLLGTLPPAAIFFKLFIGSFVYGINFPLFSLLLSMNIACAFAGYYFGSKLSGMASVIERDHWVLMLIESVVIGFIWGAATGAVGGLIAFGVGAIFGAVIAAGVGMVAFGLFVPLHRLLARGGMIDARHLWPLACGVVLFITALIL
ncbi:MAG TPA: hypothetical protein VJ715_09130 [Pyrinomonadaceae bacterium]|nr:hypothetical protein [Pyrinomonadaceae bacterium]